ncbi:hypothetical protein TraAM80_00424 [Trypanosoma rangeli]|uniref:Uncharacterized protein n=1 Tax=Trypanosoma rangeli TaxID=5698 RepID=A0A3R7P3Q9_TRYRA|nr:uncharacterized protein TraAM80_00424 [Trypanosoma rangeli]RNF12276.1 hypothetical protein TraAM80_00424 [Trypanosoma rangeli]|eukprot:RNF12276.1 hypothetical protein TraAM80_00424 [Trypanosoma rangeli]
MDPTVPPLCDGASFTLCDDDVYAFGGAVPKIIWCLHLVTRTWYETPCTGTVPAPRQNHAAASFAGKLLLCGGELLRASSTQPPRLMPFYELSLNTYTWTRIDTFGAVPLNRSHHSCSILGESMILLGGKPVLSQDEGAVTDECMNEFVRAGFYDVFILDIASRVWRSVVVVGLTPHLWGHSAVVYGGRYILVFGGMEVVTNDTVAISRHSNPHQRHEPPVAKVSNKLYLLDVDQMTLRLISPAPKYSISPRAFHAAHVDSCKMYVLGGLNVNIHGKVAVLDDLWVYDIIKGKWNAMDLPMQFPAAVRRLSFAYDSQIVVVPSITSMWYMDVHEKAAARAWREVLTSHVVIVVLPATNEAKEYNELLNPRNRAVDNDPAGTPHAEEMEISQSAPVSVAPKRFPVTLTTRMNMLMDEIHQLRELILAHHSPQQSALQQQRAERDPPPMTATERLQYLEGTNGSVKTIEKRKRDKDRQKVLARQKERMLHLMQRLEKLLLLPKARNQEKDQLTFTIEQQLLKQTSVEALNGPPIRHVAECSEHDASVGSFQPPQDNASRPQQHKGLETNAMSSLSKDEGTFRRWAELIDILKHSPSRQSSKAFQASIVIL